MPPEKKTKFLNGQRVKIPGKSTPEAPVIGNIAKVEDAHTDAPKYLVRYMLPNEKPAILREDYFGDAELELAKEGK